MSFFIPSTTAPPGPASALSHPQAMPQHSKKRDDWEDWEDESDLSDSEMASITQHDTLIDLSTIDSEPLKATTSNNQSRQSLQPQILIRIRSRHGQRAKNAKAGIRVVTDMSQLQHQRQQRRNKFVDAAALKALEGEPSSASVGSWNWLRQKTSRKPVHSRKESQRSLKTPTTAQSDLSPNPAPIVIGISLPSGTLSSHDISPQTTTLETPIDIQRYLPQQQGSVASKQTPLKSVWSPDTEATSSVFNSPSRSSSVVPPGAAYGVIHPSGAVPPVPIVPDAYRAQQVPIVQPDNDDDTGTPYTQFEEDRSPLSSRKSPARKGVHRSGWWDHVTSPFVPTPASEQTNNPFMAPSPQRATTVSSPQEWWKGEDKKKPVPAPITSPVLIVPTVPSIHTVSPIIPNNGSSSFSSASSTPTLMGNHAEAGGSGSRHQSHIRKARILAEESATGEPSSEHPPPYSYSPPAQRLITSKYAAAAPANLTINTQPLPSPGPITPAIQGTMASRGAISLEEVVLTPPPAGTAQTNNNPAPLPDRAAGTYITGDHFLSAPGQVNRVERQRRRHEKEDALAHRVGGFWRGRGCMPENGCYGRPGREGRKRRRIWLLIVTIITSLITLAVVLAVTLTRKSTSSAIATTTANSIWLNLTDFPPMPTGVLTVAGADKVVDVNGCVNPTTMWSCILPKEQQESNELFGADRPSLILQIQFDNSSQRLWDTPQGKVPNGQDSDGASPDAGDDFSNVVGHVNDTRPSSKNLRRTLGRSLLESLFSKSQKRATNELFTPVPSAPSFQEMWFLGNTTDGIESENKAGEPTPFYITILSSLNESVGSNVLSRRAGTNESVTGGIPDLLTGNKTVDDGGDAGADITFNLTGILPAPELNDDGTGAAVRFLPRPIQQPIRLYDRGLDTEHYGFYSYFDKTIYLKSITILDPPSNETVPEDSDGGSPRDAASFLVTFSETRFFVKIYTNRSNSTRLINTGTSGNQISGEGGGAVPQAKALTEAPGTFPYPMTFALDYHGGNRTRKTTWSYRVDERQKIDVANPELIANDLSVGGTWINRRDNGNPKLGGFDGGSGGCKCEWANFNFVKVV